VKILFEAEGLEFLKDDTRRLLKLPKSPFDQKQNEQLVAYAAEQHALSSSNSPPRAPTTLFFTESLDAMPRRYTGYMRAAIHAQQASL
jgi:hypothetical protein